MPARMSFSLPNDTEPTSGPVGVPITMLLAGAGVVTGDLALEQMQNVIDYVQSIYIDNSANAQAFSITFSGMAYKITVPAGKQGIFPVICGAGPLSWSAATTGAVNVSTIMFNVRLPYLMWG